MANNASPANTPEAKGELPLPDPYPDYVTCPHCGEPEVEVWCYQTQVTCHRCGQRFPHTPPTCFGSSDRCQPASASDELP